MIKIRLYYNKFKDKKYNNFMDIQLQKFNEQLNCFVNFVSDLFRDNIDIQSNISLVRVFNKSNPRKLCEMFYIKLYPHEKKINDMDENFFIELSYKEQNINQYKEFSQLFDIFREKINSDIMSQPCVESPKDTNKQRIWKYIKVLLFLSKKCHE